MRSFRIAPILVAALVAACGTDVVTPTPTVVTPPPPPPAPAAPGNLVATAGDGKVTVTWVSSGTATKYTLYWSTEEDVDIATAARVQNATSPYVHPGLVNDQEYFYKVTGTNSGGEGLPSNEASAMPRAPKLPAPTGLRVTAGDGKVTLEWDEAPGAESYSLYWSTTPGVTAESGTLIDDVTSPYVHTGLVNGVTYSHVVTASDDRGESPESNEVTSTPLGKEIEPNDSFIVALDDDLSSFSDVSEAQRIPAINVLLGAVSGAEHADPDWYEVVAPADGLLTITVQPLESTDEVDLDLNVVEERSGYPMGFGYGRIASSAETVTLPVYSGDTYSFVIHDFNWSGFNATYRLTTSFAPQSLNAADNNDAPGLSTQVRDLGGADAESISTTIAREKDIDWYEVQSNPDLTYRITLRPPGTVSYSLYSYSYNENAETWTLGSGPEVAPQQGAVQRDGWSYNDAPQYFAVVGSLKARPTVGTDFAEHRYFHPSSTYGFVIETSPSSPLNVESSSTDAGVMTLSWNTSDGATGYVIYCESGSDVAVDQDSERVADVAGASFTGAMDPGSYSCMVTAVNGVGSSFGSGVVDVLVVAPPPEPEPVWIFRETFDGDAFSDLINDGWERIDLSGDTYTVDWDVGENIRGTAFNGSDYLYADAYDIDEFMWATMATPAIAIPLAGARLRLDYLWRHASDQVAILVHNGTGWVDLLAPLVVAVSNSDWNTITIDLAAYADTTIRIGFEYFGESTNTTGYFWHIDNVGVY